MEDLSFGRQLSRWLARLLILTVIACLLGAVGYLLALLNARTFWFRVSDGKVWVLKGKLAPVGKAEYRPMDPALAEAYAPVTAESPPPPEMLTRRYERDEVDPAFFAYLAQLARPRLASDEPSDLERGLYYIHRAEKLPNITDEQRATLRSMKSDVAFFLARTRLDEARKLLADSLAQLRLAADSTNRHARHANQMISTIEPQVTALEEALRLAVHSLSESPAPAK
jgi:hypothetical protein